MILYWCSWIFGMVLAAIWMWRVFDLLRSIPHVPDLNRTEWDNLSRQPGNQLRVSIIVPALNEEAKIEPALSSLLQLDYENYEVIAIDDRSTDSTGAIMDKLASGSNGKLRVIHIKELPAGWLGKPHAMWRAAQLATGEWLLFTDADVSFRADTLRRAMAYAAQSRADHIVLFITMILKSMGERMMMGGFSQLFLDTGHRPHKAADPESRDYVGAGAFNLIRHAVYEQIGGFKALRMEVIEDLNLGRLVKLHGFAQRIVFGRGLITLYWAAGALGIIRNLTKNLFALYGFKWWRVLVGAAKIILMGILPYAGLLLAPGWSRLGYGLAVLMIFSLYFGISKNADVSPLYFLLHPVGAMFCSYAILRSAAVTTWNGGVTWRGTKYPLEELM